MLAQEFRWMERDEFDKELKDYELSGRYKMHQYIELMKNFKDAEVAQGLEQNVANVYAVGSIPILRSNNVLVVQLADTLA